MNGEAMHGNARFCTVLAGRRGTRSLPQPGLPKTSQKFPFWPVAAVPQREYARGLAVYDPRTSWARHHGSNEHGRTNERASERGELHMTEHPVHVAGARPSSAHAKALAINLDPTSYGTFAEIGAGQEVARWFLRVGGAAGTIAQTISAYDKTFSDDTYGAGTRYVSKERLAAMLDYEY